MGLDVAEMLKDNASDSMPNKCRTSVVLPAPLGAENIMALP